MNQATLTCALGFAAVTSWCSLTTAAQSGDLTAIQQKLNSQFKLTIIAADRSDIVRAGDIVAIHKAGLVMYAVASPMPPSNTYNNGKIGQGWGGFGKDLMIGMAAPGGATAADYPHRTFAAEEKCWVVGMDVQKDGVLFQLYSDPYDDVRYYANLKVPFPHKKEVPPVDVELETIAQVLTVVPQDPQTDQGGPAPGGAGQDSAVSSSANPAAGRYLRKDKSSDSLELGADGAFSLFQDGKPYGGTWKAFGSAVVLSGARIRGDQKCQLIDGGKTLIDPGGTQWLKQVEAVTAAPPAQASATAAMPAIAPPPPPADAPPPTVALGQTVDQVTGAFGQPTRVARLGTKVVYFYKDMKVTFTSGKVTDVQ